MIPQKIIQEFSSIETPFYYYDMGLLQETLDTVNLEANKRGYIVHFALKANANSRILKEIAKAGLGADCVSGNEVLKAIETGFTPELINFAGVGKTDKEIEIGLDNNIFTFNCESIQEIEVINQLSKSRNKVTNIAIRINPNVNPETHKNISTGLEENKFGISDWEFDALIETLSKCQNIKLIAIHFHIGSQITNFEVFKNLALKANHYNKWFTDKGFNLEHVNVGGGLGVNYHNPEQNKIPDFASYFRTLEDNLKLYPNQKLHCELGRSIVAQVGALISRVLYIKRGRAKNFAVLDAGMTDLMRPALYQAYHKIVNISSKEPKEELYDVVGPICESTDVFSTDVSLPISSRGDFVMLKTAGAYGETMASRYNLRNLPNSIYSTDF